MKHPVRANLWVAAAAVFALLALWVAGFNWLAAAMASILVVFGFPQHYETRETDLIVRSGLIRRKLPYPKIEAIEMNEQDPSDNAADRIHLRIGPRKWIHVRPRDKMRFVAELLAHAPHLKVSAETEGARS